MPTPLTKPVLPIPVPGRPLLVGFDVETANGKRESVCSVGFAFGYTLDEVTTWGTLVKPHPTFNYFGSYQFGIHGIRARDVAGSPEFNEVYEVLFGENGVLTELRESGTKIFLIAHNAKAVERHSFQKLARLYDLPEFNEATWPLIDTQVTAKRVGLLEHNLKAVAKYMGVKDVSSHHDATWDAEVCLAFALSQSGKNMDIVPWN